ncbi:hypothetical protein [Halalkalibacter oceani]|uniref:hypothetical protein n=1 Tax=Halalkalibacter oceani TaxID=1653776 RepID=UPI00339237A3
MDIKFKALLQSNLSASEESGTISFTDEGRLYIATSSEEDNQLEITNLIFTESLPETGLKDKLYLNVSDNTISYYDHVINKWTQVINQIDLSDYYTKEEIDNMLISTGTQYKDMVFMLGDELETGVQPYTEHLFFYAGTIEKIYVTTGLESANTSNLIFSLQKRVGTSWVNVDVMELQLDEFSKVFDVNEPINNQRLRINLISGDYANVTNMTLIAHIKIN